MPVRAAQRARELFDALVPAACVACRRGVPASGAPLCGLCRARLPALPSPRCPRCAEPVGTRPRGAPFARCGLCEEWPPEIVAAAARYVFEGVAARVVRALKYRRWRTLAPWMAEAMLPPARRVASTLRADGREPLVVPVPLAPARHRERGFNQARDLARPLARGLGLESGEALRREGGGAPQASTGGARRGANVQGRFRGLAAAPRGGRPALLVDDVLTTGATAVACARALAEAGFRPIGVVTFARTLRPLHERRTARPPG